MEQSMYGVSVSTLRGYRFDVAEAHARMGASTTPITGPAGLAYKISPIDRESLLQTGLQTYFRVYIR